MKIRSIFFVFLLCFPFCTFAKPTADVTGSVEKGSDTQDTLDVFLDSVLIGQYENVKSDLRKEHRLVQDWERYKKLVVDEITDIKATIDLSNTERDLLKRIKIQLEKAEYKTENITKNHYYGMRWRYT